jgi:hypothetical protein
MTDDVVVIDRTSSAVRDLESPELIESLTLADYCGVRFSSDREISQILLSARQTDQDGHSTVGTSYRHCLETAAMLHHNQDAAGFLTKPIEKSNQ